MLFETIIRTHGSTSALEQLYFACKSNSDQLFEKFVVNCGGDKVVEFMSATLLPPTADWLFGDIKDFISTKLETSLSIDSLNMIAIRAFQLDGIIVYERHKSRNIFE